MDNFDSIVECVPNFSEGKDQEIIDAISNAIRQHENVILVDIDSGISTNGCVYTIVGPPYDVVESIISAAKVAFQLIDMRKHKGEHKRLGALDVCPFIPIKNLDMKDCIELSKICAKNLSTTFGIPVYLYGYAATEDYRRYVPDIRQGEYEGLKEKIVDLRWKPDFGPNQYTKEVERLGATMCGARKVLIAYNINLMATKEQANKIAFDIREQGRGKDQPGVFKAVQAMGWTVEEHNISQVTINLIDYEITSLVDVWIEVNKRAKEYCLPVCGSEIVGVVPLQAILDVANHYIKEENLLLLEEDLKVKFVISKLGLSSLNEFKPREKIIEYILEDQNKRKENNRLIDLSLTKFIDQVRNRNAVPGGGSVSALAASLATSLITMVGRLSSGRKKFECNENSMKQLLPSYYDACDRFLKYVDLDAEAFTRIATANRLPETTPEEIEEKQKFYRFAIMNCIEVPRKLMNEAIKLLNDLYKLCPIININVASDLQVAITCLKCSIYGAYYNVMINLDNLTWDNNQKQMILDNVENIKNTADVIEKDLLMILSSNRTEV